METPNYVVSYGISGFRVWSSGFRVEGLRVVGSGNRTMECLTELKLKPQSLKPMSVTP